MLIRVAILPLSAKFARILQATDTSPPTSRVEVLAPPVKMVALEVTQGVQNWLNSVPLVDGRPTYVRVHAEPLEKPREQLTLTSHLRVFRGGEEVAESPIRPLSNCYVTIAQDADLIRGDWNKSINFALPQSLAAGTLDLHFETLGFELNCDEASCNESVTFGEATNLTELEIFRVEWSDACDHTFTPTMLQQIEEVKRLYAALPVSGSIRFRPQLGKYSDYFPTFSCPPMPDDREEFREKVTSWISRNGSRAYPHGILVSPLGDLGGRTLIPGFLSWDTQGSMHSIDDDHRNRIAHEVGHQLGRLHPSCYCPDGSPSGPLDSSFPFCLPHGPGGETVAALGPPSPERERVYGLDIIEQVVVDPSNTFELMSYCSFSNPPFTTWTWPSRYTYEELIGELQLLRNGRKGGENSGRLVEGTLNLGDNTGNLDPHTMVRADRNLDASLPTMDFALRVFKESTSFDEVPEEYPIVPLVSADNAERAFFLQTLPVAELSRVELLFQGVVLDAIENDGDSPTISIAEPADGASLLGNEVTVHFEPFRCAFKLLGARKRRSKRGFSNRDGTGTSSTKRLEKRESVFSRGRSRLTSRNPAKSSPGYARRMVSSRLPKRLQNEARLRTTSRIHRRESASLRCSRVR